MKHIAFPHKPQRKGGPGSFQKRFESALRARGWTISYLNENSRPDVVFVVNGTRRILWLSLCKMRGIPIVLRLDGISWQHRIESSGIRHWLRAEATNWLVQLIRVMLADYIVYQSAFIEQCWNSSYGRTKKPSVIIYNGVDSGIFKPMDTALYSTMREEVVCVEGCVNGTPAAAMLIAIKGRSVHVYGDVAMRVQEIIESSPRKNIKFAGSVPREEIPYCLQGRKVFLNLEVIPPCPNAVIEAMACGVPVVGFNTGSLYEIVGQDAGILLPYGRNPWKLEVPKVEGLNAALDIIFSDYDRFSRAARRRAEEKFSLNNMVEAYLEVIEKAIMSDGVDPRRS